jgi:hypothetical protein
MRWSFSDRRFDASTPKLPSNFPPEGCVSMRCRQQSAAADYRDPAARKCFHAADRHGAACFRTNANKSRARL